MSVISETLLKKCRLNIFKQWSYGEWKWRARLSHKITWKTLTTWLWNCPLLAVVLINSISRRGDVALQHIVYLHEFAPDFFLFMCIKQYLKEDRFSDSEIQWVVTCVRYEIPKEDFDCNCLELSRGCKTCLIAITKTYITKKGCKLFSWFR